LLGKFILLALCGLWLTAFAPAQSLPPNFFGMNVLHAINNTPWPAAPVSSLRLWDSDDTRWSAIEPSRGKFNFEGLDRWLALAEKHHAEVLYTFGRVPAWANDNQRQSVPPKDLKDWDDFVRALVRHAKGRIHAYELWNEPNQSNFWSSDVKTLLEMGSRAYRIIKQEQPGAIVTTPAPTWHTVEPYQWLQTYLDLGGGKFADVIAFHGYVGVAPESLTGELERIRRVAKNNDVDKPIWDTESSWGIDSKLPDANAQSAFLARSYILHVSQGVHRFYWYAWDGSDGNTTISDRSWGTLWDRNGVRPPGEALASVVAWLQQATLPLICTTQQSTWTCKLNSNSMLIWDTQSQHSFTTDPRYSEYQDLSRSTHPVPANHQVTIGPSPVLLRSR